MPIYHPPDRGAPKTRFIAGTRGEQSDIPDIFVLAPEQAGLTATDQPTLYWYLSKPVHAYDVELSVLGVNDEDPLLNVRIDGDILSGIHSFALSDHGVRLKRNMDYEFSASLVLDPDERSKDIFAMGVVRSVDANSSVAAMISDGATDRQHFVWAAQGYWYDAIHAVSQLINQDPMVPLYRQQRTALLEQENLTDLAASERGYSAN